MIRNDSFWQFELKAPLLSRNLGFIKKENVEEIIKRAEYWVDLTSRYNIHYNIPNGSPVKCLNKELERLFVLDAERTFVLPEYRQIHIDTLSLIYNEILDYHQGMGFIVAFLLLFLPKEDVIKIVLTLNRYYIPKYFMAEPIGYARDAKVFDKLIEKYHPNLHKHFEKLYVIPHAYCSRWFIGLNVNVFSFKALFDFLDAVFSDDQDLEQGLFLFKFGLSVIRNISDSLLASDNVATVLMHLRFCPTIYPDTYVDSKGATLDEFFQRIVEDAKDVYLSPEEIRALRKQAYEEVIQQRERLAAKSKDNTWSESEESSITFSSSESEHP